MGGGVGVLTSYPDAHYLGSRSHDHLSSLSQSQRHMYQIKNSLHCMTQFVDCASYFIDCSAFDKAVS